MGPEVGAALVSGGSSLLGGLFGNSSAKREAARNRDFQERMIRNQHTYQVEDLRRAGLNPILSANSGAGGASGSMADVGSNIVGDAVNSAQSARRLKEEIENMDKQNDVLETEASVNRATEKSIRENTKGTSFDNEQRAVDAAVANTPMGVIKSIPGVAGLLALGGAGAGFLGGKASSAYSSWAEKRMLKKARGGDIVKQGRGLKIEPKRFKSARNPKGR